MGGDLPCLAPVVSLTDQRLIFRTHLEERDGICAGDCLQVLPVLYQPGPPLILLLKFFLCFIQHSSFTILNEPQDFFLEGCKDSGCLCKLFADLLFLFLSSALNNREVGLHQLLHSTSLVVPKNIGKLL